MSTHEIIALILVIIVAVVFLAAWMCKLANHIRKKQLKESFETAANAFENYRVQVKKALEQEEQNEAQ